MTVAWANGRASPPPAGQQGKGALPCISITLRRKGEGKKSWPEKPTKLATWFNN